MNEVSCGFIPAELPYFPFFHSSLSQHQKKLMRIKGNELSNAVKWYLLKGEKWGKKYPAGRGALLVEFK